MSSLPGTSTITTYGCPTDTGTSDGSVPCGSDACVDPFYAMDHADSCDAVTVTSLRVEPTGLGIVMGRLGKVRVIATFSTGQEADVTDEARVYSQNDEIAAYLSEGVVQANAEGAVWLEGIWEGYSARATVTVTDEVCVGATGWDVCFVLDQSVGTAFLPFRRPGQDPEQLYIRRVPLENRVDYFDEVLLSMQLALSLTNEYQPSDPGADRVSIVLTGDGEPTVAQNWTNALTVLASTGTYQDTRLGRALQRAQYLMLSARPAARKLVVVVTNGGEWGCNPTALSVALQLQEAGVLVAMVTPVAANGGFFSACSYPQSAYDYLQSCASPCLFYGGLSFGALTNALGDIQREACGGECASGS